MIKVHGRQPCFIEGLNFFHVALIIVGGVDVGLAISTKTLFVALNNEKETTRSLFLPFELLVEKVVGIFSPHVSLLELMSNSFIHFQYFHWLVDSWFPWGLKTYDSCCCSYVLSYPTHKVKLFFLVWQHPLLVESSWIVMNFVKTQEIPFDLACLDLSSLLLLSILTMAITFFLVHLLSSWPWSIAIYSIMQTMTFILMIHCSFLPLVFLWMCLNLIWVVVPIKSIHLGVVVVCIFWPCTSSQVPIHVTIILAP